MCLGDYRCFCYCCKIHSTKVDIFGYKQQLANDAHKNVMLLKMCLQDVIAFHIYCIAFHMKNVNTVTEDAFTEREKKMETIEQLKKVYHLLE